MSLFSLRPSVLTRPPHVRRRRLGHVVTEAVGWLLIGVGLVGAILPLHLGVPLLVVGLIIVLRTSRQARRQFIGLQRRHPKFVFPIRRLLRRDPEVLAVAWQQVLRAERFFLPRTWRPARVVRRWIFRRRRPSR
jgi:hypothetical protein